MPRPNPDEAALLEKLIAQAKGYRPLYQLLAAEVKRAIPELQLSCSPDPYLFWRPGGVCRRWRSTLSEVRLGLQLWGIVPSMRACSARQNEKASARTSRTWSFSPMRAK